MENFFKNSKTEKSMSKHGTCSFFPYLVGYTCVLCNLQRECVPYQLLKSTRLTPLLFLPTHKVSDKRPSACIENPIKNKY